MLHASRVIRLIVLSVVAVLTCTTPATAATANLVVENGVPTLVVADDAGVDSEFWISDSADATYATATSFITVELKQTGRRDPIALAPAAGCFAYLDIEYGTGNPKVQCAYEVVGRVRIDAGDGADSVAVVTSSDAAARRLPAISVDLGGGADTFTGYSYGNEPAEDVRGGAGNDVINGGAGNDLLDGGVGNDMITGAHGADRLLGGIGNDQLAGHSLVCSGACGDGSRDQVFGGAGNDHVTGNDGPDLVDAGPGNDTIDEEGDRRVDTIRGGGGRDKLYSVDYNARTYRLIDRVSAVERVTERLLLPRVTWSCVGQRCTVRLKTWKPSRFVIVFI